MSENYISSKHIQKIGHHIQEIRERALTSLISKLDRGYKFDNNLARSKELIEKLFEWFLLEPCTHKNDVFNLIEKIFKSDSGKILINHYSSKTFIDEINRVRPHIDTKFVPKLDELINFLDNFKLNIVPPLETDNPLSNRSDHSNDLITKTKSTIENYYYYTLPSSKLSPSTSSLSSSKETCPSPNNKNFTFQWQYLIESDRNVLHSFEKSLNNTTKSSIIQNSCQFFKNVLLQDFPNEVFLQRPGILTIFYNLLLNSSIVLDVKNSILNCLIALVDGLQRRINCYVDPCLNNCKFLNISQNNSNLSSPNNIPSITSSSNSNVIIENIYNLKSNELSVPQFCLKNMKAIFEYLLEKCEFRDKNQTNQLGTNIALNLLGKNIDLLKAVINQEVWNNSCTSIINDLNEVLNSYGDILHYFKIETTSKEFNLNSRVIYLFIMHNCSKFLINFIPLSQCSMILPQNLKISLVECLLDVHLSKLYSNVYQTILSYIKSFSVGLDSFYLDKINEINKICISITSAIKFLKSKSTDTCNDLNLVENGLQSIEFIKDVNFLKKYVEICANKLPLCSSRDNLFDQSEKITLQLLAHNCKEIKLEMYRLCYKCVIAAVGPQFNSYNNSVAGSSILFLLKPKIFTEIAMFGVNYYIKEINEYAEVILNYILKSKILVMDNIWMEILNSFYKAFPIILCHASNDTNLGRLLINMLDPDTGLSLTIRIEEILKGNIILLFSKDLEIRKEAYSRLCWLLSNQENAKNFLPRLNNFQDKSLPNVFQLSKIFSINKNRSTEHFYQPSSMIQVLELLKSSNVEPVIRRSALTQISVMMEDHLLHVTFLENDGISIIIKIMISALNEKDFDNYPDSIISIINILKNLCLFQSNSRLELSQNSNIYYYILRGVFLFLNENRLRQDASILLFCLLFNDFIEGTPAKANLSIPQFVADNFIVPFNTNYHWKTSPYSTNSPFETLTSDRWCLNSIQIQYNLEIFGGFNELLNKNEIVYKKGKIPEFLKLNKFDMDMLKATSVDYCIKKLLLDIINGTRHDTVLKTIDNLSCYLLLFKVSKEEKDYKDLMTLNWEITFSRYLKILPSSEEDVELLIMIIDFLKILTPFFEKNESFWFIKILKSKYNYLVDLLNVEKYSDNDYKTLTQDLLSILILCSLQEQNKFHTNYLSEIIEKKTISWTSIIDIIVDNLKFFKLQPMFNLSQLNSYLDCLVHLTATLGWCDSKNFPKNLILCLYDLIQIFYGRKGVSASISVMGLSIIKNSVLILNHIIIEMIYSKVKNWEMEFLEMGREWLKNIVELWYCRDVIVRAASVQLFVELTNSSTLTIDIINDIKVNENIFDLAMTLFTDHEECSLVREYSAVFLANFIEIIKPTSLMKMLDLFNFFTNILTILNCSCTKKLIYFDDSFDKTQLKIDDNIYSLATPSFIKQTANLLIKILKLHFEDVTNKLNELGLVKLFFKCLCNPTLITENSKNVPIYCDILEMNTTICLLLKEISRNNFICLGTILHTKDCLNVMISLLDSNIYLTYSPQLIHQRNKLWCEIFGLITVLMNVENEEFSIEIFIESLNESKPDSFITTLCESLRSSKFTNLQNAAICALTSLLKCKSNSIRNILDDVKTPKIERLDIEEQENIEPVKEEITILDEIYFNKKLLLSTSSLSSSSTSSSLLPSNISDSIKNYAGEEICKILLNLFDLTNISKRFHKKKSIVVAALTGLMYQSKESKKIAFNNNLLTIIIKQLREIYIKLSLESVDCLRRIIDKKRICPLLENLNDLIGLLNNFLYNDTIIKNEAVNFGLSDYIHKLWIWFTTQNNYLINVLQLLNTFICNCDAACVSLMLTSSVAGSGPRKVPSNFSLLHAIINLINKEMDQISKTHNLTILELSFNILNCCTNLNECRNILCKSNLLQTIGRLHPLHTKRQKPWDTIEYFWLEFLNNFTIHNDGQMMAKNKDIIELIFILVNGGKSTNKLKALEIIRNFALNQSNRPLLLGSDEFIKILQNKLDNGCHEEKYIVVLIIWTLAANSQKTKTILKSAQLDVKLQQYLQQYLLSQEDKIDEEFIKTINYVLNILNNGEKK